MLKPKKWRAKEYNRKVQQQPKQKSQTKQELSTTKGKKNYQTKRSLKTHSTQHTQKRGKSSKQAEKRQGKRTVTHAQDKPKKSKQAPLCISCGHNDLKFHPCKQSRDLLLGEFQHQPFARVSWSLPSSDITKIFHCLHRGKWEIRAPSFHPYA